VQPKQAVAKKPKNEENNNTITTPKRGLQPHIFLKLTKQKNTRFRKNIKDVFSQNTKLPPLNKQKNPK
jgi:hypothetical protein